MKLKQPAIPGVWGSWDPDTGSEEVPTSEWPQFDPADVPVHDTLPTAPKGGTGAQRTPLEESNSRVERARKVLSSEHSSEIVMVESGIKEGTDSRPSSKKHEAQTDLEIDSAPLEPRADTIEQPGSRFSPSKAALTVSHLPSQTFFPVRHSERTSPQADRSLEYTAPKHLPRPTNPTLDVDKDLAVKSAMVEARKTYGNGPMWGVAAPPPMTFDGTEDYDKITAEAQAMQSGVDTDGRRTIESSSGPTELSSDTTGRAKIAEDGDRDHGLQSGKEQNLSKGKLHTWMGQGSWWETKW